MRKYAINQIYAGKFLEDNLGHELINFLPDEKGRRYIYLMPMGMVSKQAANNLEYVFHVMRTDKGCYELIATSKVKRGSFDRAAYEGDQKCRSPIFRLGWFKRLSFFDIFGVDGLDCKVYSLEAESLWHPKKGVKIVFKMNQAQSLGPIPGAMSGDPIMVSLQCSWDRLIGYATKDDELVLDDLMKNGYLEKDESNIDFKKIDDELCFASIGDRTRLEDSLSNELAYFLRRDPSLMRTFIENFLGLAVGPGEEFTLIREKEKNIDLFFKSDRQAIVIENKIDAPLQNGQLKKYWDHVEAEYPNLKKSYFVLTPTSHSLTPTSLKGYPHGDKYTLVHYDKLYDVLKDAPYRPDGRKGSQYSRFLFGQLLKSIECLTQSKAEEARKIALTRFKQRCLLIASKKRKPRKA